MIYACSIIEQTKQKQTWLKNNDTEKMNSKYKQKYNP